MASVEEKVKSVGFVGSGSNLLEGMKLLKEMQEHTVPRKLINSELWHACAGPLVTLPQVGSLVYYFPQGHSEQVAVSTNRAATAQIPKYPNLPPQLLCQVHNVTLHGDKDTDEIYAQISLQPVNSDKDVIPIPDFGMKPCKHPTEFFCKTLTASDTSTHGGFSVPRRAAEKLFPLLDYSMQPPTQELIVRDLHDNTWTFRHIYRGQPKRHLLTTGWSMFVGAKRLRAGDAILFVRDEKSQLLLGVRRANRQQATLPSSVLSADSMHIGILAAAAHAAANRSPFTIFYNPRACSSEFVIPLVKYRKAVFGTQLSVSMRFGMMFETEESNKRRYMGTITGISDLDPLRWPNSKWRSLQVEWDEPGCGDKRNRVSPWEIETPESLFIFPSLSANMKRPFHSAFMGAPTEWDSLMNRQFLRIPDGSPANFQCPTVPGMWSDQLRNILIQPQNRLTSSTGCIAPALQDVADSVSQEMRPLHSIGRQKLDTDVFPREESDPVTNSSVMLTGKVDEVGNYACFGTSTELNAKESAEAFSSPGGSEEKVQCSVTNLGNVEQNGSHSAQQARAWTEAQPINSSQLEPVVPNPLLQYPGQGDLVSCPPICDAIGSVRNLGAMCIVRKFDDHSASSDNPYVPLPPENQELWEAQFNSNKCTNIPSVLSQHDISNLPYSLCGGLKGFNGENNNQSDIYSYLNDGSNSGSTVMDPSVSSMVLDDFFALKKGDFQSPCDYILGNMSSNQDVQSQITSASLADSQGFSIQEFADNSGGASSSNVDFDDRNILQQSSWNPVAPRCRTYTKIQKAGSVGRSIDVSGFKNYDELRAEIERMFGLEGLLNDLGSGWKLVYVDFENDVLLVGDDPWEEFVGCVKCIRILSPPEVKQMGEEGMQLLNSVGIHGIDGSNSS